MNVEPNTKTTLLVNSNHMAFNFCTARTAIRHLITGRIKGVDAVGNIVSWDGSEIDRYPSVSSSLSWVENTVSLFDDQPYLRSAPSSITGEETRRYIPTVAVCTSHFGYHPRKGESVSLKTLYRIYKGTCQYCHEHIHFADATKDHYYPKSMGGTNDDFNLVLACRQCNNAKDSVHPFYDKDGKEPRIQKMSNIHTLIPDDRDIRDEWKPYLYID